MSETRIHASIIKDFIETNGMVFLGMLTPDEAHDRKRILISRDVRVTHEPDTREALALLGENLRKEAEAANARAAYVINMWVTDNIGFQGITINAMLVFGDSTDIAYFDNLSASADHVDFGVALRAMQFGYRARRANWLADQFIYIVKASEFEVNRAPLLGFFREGQRIQYSAHIDIHLYEGRFGVWAPQNDDMLASNWQILPLQVKP